MGQGEKKEFIIGIQKQIYITILKIQISAIYGKYRRTIN